MIHGPTEHERDVLVSFCLRENLRLIPVSAELLRRGDLDHSVVREVKEVSDWEAAIVVTLPTLASR